MSMITLSPSANCLSLSRLVSKVLTCPTRAACMSLLMKTKGKDKISTNQRRDLCELAGVEQAWIQCDQSVEGNIEDISTFICSELYEPYQFYTKSLQFIDDNHQRATIPLQWTKRKKFWSAWNEMKTYTWIPPRKYTYDAVVHFIQEGSGTGVHVGDGLILTCAHVVDSRDDSDEMLPERIGRVKCVVFPNGKAFLAKCVAVSESKDGILDTAVMQLLATIPFPQSGAPGSFGEVLLPFARLSADPALPGSDIFCIGNPSSIDLESVSKKKQTVEFNPPTWHTSVGSLDTSVDGQLLTHTCWTYWGHSGAPLFNENGDVVGLHCAWDDVSGVRQAQRLESLLATLRGISESTIDVIRNTGGNPDITATESSNYAPKTKLRKRNISDVIDLT